MKNSKPASPFWILKFGSESDWFVSDPSTGLRACPESIEGTGFGIRISNLSNRQKYRVMRAMLIALFFLSPLNPASSQDDRVKQIEGAKKEGKLVWYTSTNLTESKPLLNDFEKQYPFIKGEIFRASGVVILNRIITETRASKWNYDV